MTQMHRYQSMESSYCVKDKNGLDYEIPQFEVKWMIQGVIFGT